MPLTSRFTAYAGGPKELKRFLNLLYQYHVGEIIDLVIDNLSKEGGYNDKQGWGVLFLDNLIRRKILMEAIYRT